MGEISFRSGGSSFAYSADLLDADHSVLGQVFEESPRARFHSSTGLPAWFANLLPEKGSGLRSYYAAQYGERVIDDARLLLSLGADLPGALTVEPIEVPAEGVLVDATEARIGGGRLHLSALAGAQPKMSVTRDGERLTLPARGESGSWIVKLPNPTWTGLVENEFLMMQWARAAGLDVPAVSLFPAADVPDIFDAHLDPGTRVFAVERFDRDASTRIHIEDLAQVTGCPPSEKERPDYSYDGIGLVLCSILHEDDVDEYVRRLAAMVIMGNGDAHLKNWSLIYPDRRTPRLSPAYDLVCTTRYRNLGDKLIFPLGGEIRSDQIGVDEFAKLARSVDLEPARVVDLVRTTADALRSSWLTVRDDELAPEVVAHLDHRLAFHPLR